jgi:23S rRNA pseudouridine2457 synthase
MTAAIGFPTLRLVRYSIGKYNLNGIKNGHYQQLKGE